MQIQYNVKAPPKRAGFGAVKSEEAKAIEDFLTSGNAKNMCFQYDTAKEAKSKMSTIASHRKRWTANNPGKAYDAYRVEAAIYIVRVTMKKG